MGLTINFTLLKRRQRDDGTIPIYLRITENRKSSYRSTGFWVKQKDWDNKEQEVKGSHRRYKHINIKLRRLYREVETVRDDLEINGNLSKDTLLDAISEDKDNRSIINQGEIYRTYLQDEDRYWARRHFKVVLGNLKSFIKDRKKPDQLNNLDSQWIEDFQDYLLTEVGNANNTVRKKIQRLKGMTDWLFKNEEIKQDPFSRVDKVEPKRTSNKIKLSFDQISAIENLNLEKGSKVWHTRNYFMYSFYNAGIRFGDLCCLTWGNLIDGRLVYAMNKTGKQKSINQLPPMYQLLLHYVTNCGQYIILSRRDPKDTLQKAVDPMDLLMPMIHQYAQSHANEYIFPILDEHYEDPMELRRKISSKNVQANKRLKIIAGKAGIQANISFHVSRHSFAHYALKKGMDLYAISKALGHSDLKVTEEYLKTFDEELLDKSMNKLFS
ncbi:Site-specific recombinase XerD [Fodinibius roseus]|uniref:Site-specific recombinase XerD n=1 Tax=Fodinibius roseus TaxID=1194090 RepID=A0A1M5K1J4_9BACT|nr:site-specific integrase [Fodinibius roseus]SHG46410.1 Site-specific recombinase XerD [Fodinibius roseus]